MHGRLGFAGGLFATVVLGWCLTGAADAAPPAEEIALFTSGQDGYHTYRIPALLVTPQGTALAFCEGRKTGRGDHGDLDLMLKRSTDGARTWSSQVIVYEEGDTAKITIGNPCPVVDRTTGVIWLPFCRDNKAVLITSSADEGLTWTPPVDISSAVMQPNWSWVATGPGIGIQLTRGKHQGRLVIPCDHRIDHPGGNREWNSHMMFSDDAGKTWQIGKPIQTGGNECQVIERADGSLLVNTRMQGEFQGFRGIATSQDGGVTWTDIVHDSQLPCPKCQGSLIRYSASTTTEPGRLLFSNPHPPQSSDGKPSGARVRLTIRSSTDDGRTWPVARVLHEGPSAYSSLARLADGTVLCLYEAGEKSAYDTIRLARFPLEWLTSADQN